MIGTGRAARNIAPLAFIGRRRAWLKLACRSDE